MPDPYAAVRLAGRTALVTGAGGTARVFGQDFVVVDAGTHLAAAVTAAPSETPA